MAKRRDELGRYIKQYNTYDLTGKFGIGYTTNNNSEFYFDLEDYDLIKDLCWFEHEEYIVSNTRDKKHIKLHALIMGLPNNPVDHKNHNKFDNRKDNLRIANHSKNGMNMTKLACNSSGVTGVGWNKDKDKWRSRITVNNKVLHLGYYDDFNDAVKARKDAEEKYFGEWSYDNSTRKEVV